MEPCLMPKGRSIWVITPFSATNMRIMEQMTTMEMKCGM